MRGKVAEKRERCTNVMSLILCLDGVFPPVLCRQGVLLFNGLECLKFLCSPI